MPRIGRLIAKYTSAAASAAAPPRPARDLEMGGGQEAPSTQPPAIPARKGQVGSVCRQPGGSRASKFRRADARSSSRAVMARPTASSPTRALRALAVRAESRRLARAARGGVGGAAESAAQAELRRASSGAGGRCWCRRGVGDHESPRHPAYTNGRDSHPGDRPRRHRRWRAAPEERNERWRR